MQRNQLKRSMRNNLVNFLDGWSVIVGGTSTSSTWEASWSTSRHTTWHATSTFATSPVEFHHNRIGNGF